VWRSETERPRVVVIANPSASSYTPARLAYLEGLLTSVAQVRVARTQRRGHATDLAREAVDAGADIVVVAAGDGTLNEAANGLVGSAAALAPLPGGSTNVFARTLGYANRFRRAAAQLADAIAAGARRRIGAGIANGRAFLFHLGVGYDAAVIERIERIPRIKRYAAHPAFAIAAIDTFARHFDRRHAVIRVQVPREAAHDGFFAIISNTVPYTFFGPRAMRVTTATGLDRPLALTLFTRFELWNVLGAAASSILTARRIQSDDTIVQRHDLTSLCVTGISGPVPWQVDGDFLGIAERIEVSYRPNCLDVITPRAPRAQDPARL
jgi:diacylglycerol kinase family enzyme